MGNRGLLESFLINNLIGKLPKLLSIIESCMVIKRIRGGKLSIGVLMRYILKGI